MGLRATLAAIRDLKTADRALAAANRTATSDTDPTWVAANQAVHQALQNPHLPRRYLDPTDR